jgi:hypothetical protein
MLRSVIKIGLGGLLVLALSLLLTTTRTHSSFADAGTAGWVSSSGPSRGCLDAEDPVSAECCGTFHCATQSVNLPDGSKLVALATPPSLMPPRRQPAPPTSYTDLTFEPPRLNF